MKLEIIIELVKAVVICYASIKGTGLLFDFIRALTGLKPYDDE